MKRGTIVCRGLCLILLLTLTLSLVGCHFVETVKETGTEVDTHLRQELDAIIAGDEDTAYAQFHPKALEREEFSAYFSQAQAYFTITGPYQLSRQGFQYNTYFGTNGKEVAYDCTYKVVSGGQTYYVIFTYLQTEDGSGFNSWRLLNETDYTLIHGIN